VSADAAAVPAPNTAAMIAELQAAMSDHAGPFKTAASLARALAAIDDLQARLPAAPPGMPAVYDPARIDWFDLRNMLLVARAIVLAATNRTESRGAHQREDFPGLLEAWTLNQFVDMKDGRLAIAKGPLKQPPVTQQPVEAGQ
jgi:succinate dehydrogenase/fumarate reductase flavoprotein subunit